VGVLIADMSVLRGRVDHVTVLVCEVLKLLGVIWLWCALDKARNFRQADWLLTQVELLLDSVAQSGRLLLLITCRYHTRTVLSCQLRDIVFRSCVIIGGLSTND